MSRARMLLPTLALLVSLSCEFLDNIQQDPSLVQNPDPSNEQSVGTEAAIATTLNAELSATGTAIVQQHDVTRTAEVGAEQAAKTAAVISTLTPSPTATPTPLPNHSPVITKSIANFVPADRTTYYTVTATDTDGNALAYRWSTTNNCGQFDWDDKTFVGTGASWFHPHPPCPDERFHPAVITVRVSDGQGGEVKYDYSGGSASGEIVFTPSP